MRGLVKVTGQQQPCGNRQAGVTALQLQEIAQLRRSPLHNPLSLCSEAVVLEQSLNVRSLYEKQSWSLFMEVDESERRAGGDGMQQVWPEHLCGSRLAGGHAHT